MDEFELIRRCFRDRAARLPGTVLGIGDDAALLDTGDQPPGQARATVAFSSGDDAAATARGVFGAAFIRLAARAARPRWATLALTLESGDAGWVDSFAAAAAAVCDACGVELVGGDTTRGPGRATVFALGTGDALPGRAAPRPPASMVEARLRFAPARAPAHAIADLVSVCVDLASRGAGIRCDDAAGTGDDSGPDVLELVAHTDAAGRDALHAASDHRGARARRPDTDA